MNHLISQMTDAVGGIEQPIANVKTEAPVEPMAGAMSAKKRPIEENMSTTSKRSKASKEHRLEQNRIAARESRRRKKKMMEELQRSLSFFTKANAALRNEHHDLTRKLLAAQNELRKQGLPIPEATKKVAPVATVVPVVPTSVEPGTTMQAMASFQQAASMAMASLQQAASTSGVALDTNAPAAAPAATK